MAGLDLQGLAVAGHGRIPLPGQLPGQGQFVPDQGQGAEFRRGGGGLEQPDRDLVAAELALGQAEIEQGFGIAGVERQRPTERLRRLLAPAQGQQYRAPMARLAGMVGTHFFGPVKEIERRRRVPFLVAEHAQPVQDVGHHRRSLQKLEIEPPGRDQIAPLVKAPRGFQNFGKHFASALGQ